MAKLSPLCQLNNGCMGCCGHSFKSKRKIKEAIVRNTNDFSLFDNLLEFRDRALPRDLRFGVCRNLIEKDSKIFCPLHPALNRMDLRAGHCDTEHFCQTAEEFSKWGEEWQRKFIEFIKSKNLDNIKYSIKIDDGTLLKEFLAELCKNSEETLKSSFSKYLGE